MTSREVGKSEFSDAEVEDLRLRLLQLKESKTWGEIAAVTGVPAGTISPFSTGKYGGDLQKIAAQLHRYFLGAAEAEQLEAQLPTEPGFQATPTSKRILTCLSMGQLGGMVAVATPPGIGKTECLRRYRDTRANVWVVTAAPSARGLPTFLPALLAAMGEKNARGTPQVLSGIIRNRVRNARALICVDEAQYLSPQAMEELRSIHDDTECGVALVGDENLIVLLRKYPQLYSRLDAKHVQRQASPADVEAIAAAWGVERRAELQFLREIAARPGAIRGVVKTLRLAIHAARAGNEPFAIDHLRDAWAMRDPSTVTA